MCFPSPSVPMAGCSQLDRDHTVRLWPVGQGLIDLACARVHDLPLPKKDKERFGIEDEWCTPEVSAALRAKLGLDNPTAAIAAEQ